MKSKIANGDIGEAQRDPCMTDSLFPCTFNKLIRSF
jgi:hypothetical protein